MNKVKGFYATLIEEITSYLEKNNNFESDEIVTKCIVDIENEKNINNIFKIPIRERLFNCVDSLEWMFYLKCIQQHIVTEDVMVDDFNAMLDTESCIIYLTTVFTLRKQGLLDNFLSDGDSLLSE